MDTPFTSGFNVGTEAPLRRIAAALRIARLTGFDTAWVVDHFMGLFPAGLWNEEFTWVGGGSPHAYFEYQTLLGWLAARAGKLRLAVGVTEPVRRHPVLIAQAFLSLSHMVRRPPILGIGAGERENIEPYGLDFDRPVSRLEEALDVVRLCFDSTGPFGYEGNHFRLDGAVLDLRSASGRRPEIWVAAHGPRMLRITGRHADGWYPTVPMSPDRYAERLGTIRKAAADAGRDGDQIVAGYQLPVVVGRSDAQARRLLDSDPLRYLALLTPAELWAEHGAHHPLGANFRGYVDFVPERHPTAEIESMMATVPSHLIGASVVWGGPATVRRRLEEYRDAGMRHLVMMPVSALASPGDAALSLLSVIGLQWRLRRTGR